MVESNNKRIAKNTMMLYFRMLLVMAVSLYTSRIVLEALGVEDFGIYNVVGGVVGFFTILSSSLEGATQRFLNYKIGKNDDVNVRKTFSASIIIHIFIAIVALIVFETVGLWFLNNKLSIPSNRIDIAQWVYHITVITFVINLIQIPYNAIIISYERMSFYAYVGIIEVALKLSIAFILIYTEDDRLIIYATLICCSTLILLLIKKGYANYHYKTSHYIHTRDKEIFRKLMSFSSWSLFGSTAVVLTNQGVNVLLNMFFGVLLNAAMGITTQVSNAINTFTLSFQTAFKPQVIKLFASEKFDELCALIIRASKFSYYMLAIISMPILLNTEFILQIWLKTVPDYTSHLCQLMIISMLLESISAPLWMTAQATGQIRRYQIIISSIYVLNFIIPYGLFQWGLPPVSALIVRVIISAVLLVVRLFLISKSINLSRKTFSMDAICKPISISLVSFAIAFLISNYNEGFIKLLFTTIISTSSLSYFAYRIGFNLSERTYIIVTVSEIFKLKSYDNKNEA